MDVNTVNACSTIEAKTLVTIGTGPQDNYYIRCVFLEICDGERRELRLSTSPSSLGEGLQDQPIFLAATTECSALLPNPSGVGVTTLERGQLNRSLVFGPTREQSVYILHRFTDPNSPPAGVT